MQPQGHCVHLQKEMTEAAPPEAALRTECAQTLEAPGRAAVVTWRTAEAAHAAEAKACGRPRPFLWGGKCGSGRAPRNTY